MNLSIVIPTYNERDNLAQLLSEIYSQFDRGKIKGEVIIVDDNSRDGTGELAENLKKLHKNLSVIHRKGKFGLSSAVLDGFQKSKGDILGVMDADLSHPPEKIIELFHCIKKENFQLVIGSRYVKDGKIIGWGFKRKLLSKGAVFLSRIFTKIKDPMSGFFMIKKECIEDRKLNPKGFKLLLELIIKANYNAVKEIPIVFTNRTRGKSKAGVKEVVYYLGNLIGYLPYKKGLIKEFFKFALVGFTGMVLNLFVLYTLTEFFNVYYLLSAIFAFIIAVTNNFILNKIYTFGERMAYKTLSKYIKFFSVSLAALAFNLLFLYSFTEFFGIYYLISQILAIGISLIINFFGNKIWTFGR